MCGTGHDSLGGSVWLGLALWSAACLGELRVFSQPSMLIVLWLAGFILPGVYVTCRSVLDSLVDEAFHFVASLLYDGELCCMLQLLDCSMTITISESP